MTKAKLFTATFRTMENIKEINVAEIFVAAVDDIDPEGMFDLRGRDRSMPVANARRATGAVIKSDIAIPF